MTCDCDCDCTVTVWRGAKRHMPHGCRSQKITFSTAPGTKCDHSSFSHHHVMSHHTSPSSHTDVLRCCSRHPQYTVRTATRSDCSDGFYAKMQHAALTPVHSGPFVLRAFCFFLLPLGPFETACHAGKKTRPDAVSKAAAPNPVRCVPLVAVVVVFVAVRHSISGLCRWW